MSVNTRHWHGYEWSGSPAELGEGDHRRPNADTERMATFMRAAVPPIEVGYWLWRRHAASSARTWADVDEAIRWMTSRYEHTPPDAREGESHLLPLNVRVGTTRDGLLNGVDGWWQYYTSSMGVVVIAAICCPHTHVKARPGHTLCPLPHS